MPEHDRERELEVILERIQQQAPIWVRWPVWAQILMWLGPPMLIAGFFMAQESGFIRSPIIENGKNITALLSQEQVTHQMILDRNKNVDEEMGEIDELNKRVDREISLLEARTVQFTKIEDMIQYNTNLNLQELYVAQKDCLAVSKDKKDCIPPPPATSKEQINWYSKSPNWKLSHLPPKTSSDRNVAEETGNLK